MAGKIILKTTIKRMPNMLYYCGTDAEGNLTINETAMQHGGRKKKAKAKPVKKPTKAK